MICPECESEYREGILQCVDCDVPLVSEWAIEKPSTQLVPLVEGRSSVTIGELIERLEKAAIPYVIEAGTALAMLVRETTMDAPQEWEGRVWVAEAYKQQAKTILQEVYQELRVKPDNGGEIA